jgi:hypothetical protein
VNLDLFFAQYLEESGQQGHEFIAIHCLVSIHVQQIEKILDIVNGGLLSSDQVNQGLDHPRELALGEAVIFVGVELIEDLFEQRGNVFIAETTHLLLHFCYDYSIEITRDKRAAPQNKIDLNHTKRRRDESQGRSRMQVMLKCRKYGKLVSRRCTNITIFSGFKLEEACVHSKIAALDAASLSFTDMIL